jgi:hypothetical protein
VPENLIPVSHAKIFCEIQNVKKLFPERKIHPVLTGAFSVKTRLICPGFSRTDRPDKNGLRVTDRAGVAGYQVKVQLHRIY